MTGPELMADALFVQGNVFVLGGALGNAARRNGSPGTLLDGCGGDGSARDRRQQTAA